jgi:signal transduction histidine kinase
VEDRGIVGSMTENSKDVAAAAGSKASAESECPKAMEVLEHSPGALLLLGGEGEILFVNEAARGFLSSLGVSAPSNVDDLPPQLQAAVRASAADAGGPVPGKLKELVAGLWGVQLPVKELDPDWLQGMVEAEQMAAVGQMAATVAQEIGGPNTSIQVAVDRLLACPLALGEQEQAVLRQVLTQTERITRLTRQLIALADPGRPQLVPLDVNEIAASACELMEGSYSSRGITIEAELGQGPVRAMADRNHLLQALVNLLLNARTALQAWTGERRVRVRTEGNAERVFLHVEDSGPGILPEEASRIFLPFVSTTGGTGMGLFLTRQILVEQRGGIKVQPRSGLGGATFTVYLEKAIDD